MSILFDSLMAMLCIGQVLQKPSKGRDAVIALLLRYVDPNVVSKMLREPLLHTAISKADFSLMEMLLNILQLTCS